MLLTLPIFEILILLSEWGPYILAFLVVLAFSVNKPLRLPIILLAPVFLASLSVLALWECRKLARDEGYDMNAISLREAVEEYISSGTGDLDEIIDGKKYPPILGPIEVGRFYRNWLFGAVAHDTKQDSQYLPEAYNKGDDWFEATLNEPMVYTGAIHADPSGTMWHHQLNKLEFIAHALGIKPGDKAMDIGCGWGRLSNHMASKGAKVTGVTMSSDQAAYARRMSEKLGNKDNVDIVLKNFFDLEMPAKHFNVISSVEMAEHVGIKNYVPFLRKVHNLLADDGVFYLQVAGLPRGYASGYNHYQELIWGLFMDEHVFPGADASCPMGWVLTKLERAGFEVQSVHNLGTHYSQTLDSWLRSWESKKDSLVKTYGERSFRRWQVFLRWSVSVSAKGGSTVQFITATKSGHAGARKAAQDRLAPGAFKLPEPSACPGGGPTP